MVTGPPSQESPTQQSIRNSMQSETVEDSVDLFHNLTANLILNYSDIDDIDPGEINAVHGIEHGKYVPTILLVIDSRLLTLVSGPG